MSKVTVHTLRIEKLPAGNFFSTPQSVRLGKWLSGPIAKGREGN
jgi:hypothetical protein